MTLLGLGKTMNFISIEPPRPPLTQPCKVLLHILVKLLSSSHSLLKPLSHNLLKLLSPSHILLKPLLHGLLKTLSHSLLKLLLHSLFKLLSHKTFLMKVMRSKYWIHQPLHQWAKGENASISSSRTRSVTPQDPQTSWNATKLHN
jgi:hypothetical protein